jgi:hypothetical protein
MSLLVIAVAVIVLLIFVTNTKRWRAVGSGLKKSKRDLGNEIEELREPDPLGLRACARSSGWSASLASAPFPFRLPLDGPLGAAVADATRLLARSAGALRRPIAFCHGRRTGRRDPPPSRRYSEALVVFEEPSLAYRLGFALGVQLFVERDDGKVLFQQRGPSIGRDPLLWTASASGGLKPGEEPRFAILGDAAEEARLSEGDLEDLRPVAVVVNDATGSASSSTAPALPAEQSREPTTSRSRTCAGPPSPRSSAARSRATRSRVEALEPP